LAGVELPATVRTWPTSLDAKLSPPYFLSRSTEKISDVELQHYLTFRIIHFNVEAVGVGKWYLNICSVVKGEDAVCYNGGHQWPVS
jgi:hypothetical protein